MSISWRFSKAQEARWSLFSTLHYEMRLHCFLSRFSSRGSCFYLAWNQDCAKHAFRVYICVFGWPERVMKRSLSLQELLRSNKAVAEEEEEEGGGWPPTCLWYFVSFLHLLTNYASCHKPEVPEGWWCRAGVSNHTQRIYCIQPYCVFRISFWPLLGASFAL